MKHIKCLLFLFGFLNADSQNIIGLPLIKNYNKLDFRGGNQTWDIDQDAQGRMCFANNEGLITFDGTYWKIFPLPNKTIMRAVKVAPDGKIYVGGQGEAGFFAPGRGGNLVYHSIVDKISAENRIFADIWKIEWLGDKVFFMASDRIFELSDDIVKIHWAHNEWIFMKESKGKLMAQDKENGLFVWSNGIWKSFRNGLITGSEIIHGVIPLTSDSILLVTKNTKKLLVIGDTLVSLPKLDEVSGTYITNIAQLNEDAFVLGTSNLGCIIINKSGKMLQEITSREGLQDNSILCVFKDVIGNLWIGLNNGISMVAYNAPIKFIKPDKISELSGYGSTIFNNNLYIATNDGVHYVPLTGGAEDISFIKGSFRLIENTGGLSYRFDEINKSLLLAHNEGIFTIQGSTATKISSDPSWLFVPIGSVMPSSRILTGSYMGFKWLNYSRSSFSATQNLEGLRESFRFVAIDNQDRIWTSHPYRGIYKVIISGDSLSYTTQLFTEKNGLPSTLDNHVYKIRNRVVFATSNGPYEYDATENRFIQSPLLWVMLGNIPLRYLKEDNEGNIWFVTGKKLGFLEINGEKEAGFEITYFPELDSRILSGFEHIFPYNRENVFVGSEKGLILINLSKYLKMPQKHKVLITSVSVFGKMDSTIWNGFDSAKSSLPIMNHSLPYQGNSIHFEFSSPAFSFQDNIEYSFILEGFEKTWSKWMTKTEKDYTNLPHGTYTFKVKGRNNLGLETEAVEFTFTIAAPWYKSNLAYLAYLCLLLLGIYILRYYHRKKLNRQKKIYEAKQAQLRLLHQLEIEKNEKEIIRLQNEKLANEVTFKTKELADTSMHLVERGDALSKVKDLLQKLYKSNPADVELKRAIHLVNDIEKTNTEWDKFASSFDEINSDFLKKLKEKYPVLTNNDLKLSAYLHLKMSSKEISQLLNISLRGVEISRYRLRKKMGIPTEVSLSVFFETFK